MERKIGGRDKVFGVGRKTETTFGSRLSEVYTCFNIRYPFILAMSSIGAIEKLLLFPGSSYSFVLNFPSTP